MQSKTVTLLENRNDGIDRYLKRIGAVERGNGGAVVLNCNPFTLDQLSLVEYAAKQCDTLFLFVTEKDRSLFPFSVRLELAKRGTAHLKNVRVYPGGTYIGAVIDSSRNFFEKETAVVVMQAELDATLFGEKIAAPLGIRSRFVGEEMGGSAADVYNKIMRKALGSMGIRLEEVPGKIMGDERAITASQVCDMIKENGTGDWLHRYLPKESCNYLCGRQANAALENLRIKQTVGKAEKNSCAVCW